MAKTKPYVGALVMGDPSTALWQFLDLVAKANPGTRIRVEGKETGWNVAIFNRKGTLLATGGGRTRHDALDQISKALAEAARLWRKSADEQLSKITVPRRKR